MRQGWFGPRDGWWGVGFGPTGWKGWLFMLAYAGGVLALVGLSKILNIQPLLWACPVWIIAGSALMHRLRDVPGA
ncbi:hypothetical protein FBZ89_101460 [Nitrospirillum amazonense]|uniref:Uncharacterized protein n=1 Tax=Nitrospirillum amazonense TaxID=28077 RepID=A0A560FT71_9PROT|nr:hypothetical protein [Nitrospirillum amazonense]TWB24834.1 hypothetical protein FBZ89_101460 [Nitrospirillum amazonense]